MAGCGCVAGQVKTNQADARRRQGLAVTGKEEVVLPFQNSEVRQPPTTHHLLPRQGSSSSSGVVT